MRPAAVALAALALATVFGCGGSEPDVDTVLDRAFGQPVGSAEMSFTADVRLEGLPEGQSSFGLRLEGPYESGDEQRLPSFDLDVGLSGGELPAPTRALGMVSTGDNLYVEIAGTAYEAGEKAVARELRERRATSPEEDGLGALGVDPRTWVEGGAVEGEEEVDGVATTHVTGAISVPRMIADLNAAAQRAASLGEEQAPVLSEQQIAGIDEVVQDPRFDLYAGAADGKIRMLDVSVSFDVPEEDRAGLGGLGGGSLALRLEFTGVGEPVEIAAPKSPRPLSELGDQVGALGGLPGGLPGTLPGDSSPGAPPGSPPGGSGGGGAADLQSYSQCIQQADPSEVARCSELLGAP